MQYESLVANFKVEEQQYSIVSSKYHVLVFHYRNMEF